MNNEITVQKWNADLYDQQVTETDDVEFILSIIGDEPRNILEVCCGSGRILVPLAMVGHTTTGFDMDEFMMERIAEKAKGLSNIRWYKANAITENWGDNFDVVVLAGNILINIVADMEYKEAQKLFIKKTYDSLKKGGHICLDFDISMHPEKSFGDKCERVIFEGTDDDGVYGKYIILGGTYDSNTQIAYGESRTELLTNEGQKIIVKRKFIKHIPTLNEVTSWLTETGFTIQKLYGDHSGNPITENTHRAIIWAEKGDINICK